MGEETVPGSHPGQEAGVLDGFAVSPRGLGHRLGELSWWRVLLSLVGLFGRARRGLHFTPPRTPILFCTESPPLWKVAGQAARWACREARLRTGPGGLSPCPSLHSVWQSPLSLTSQTPGPRPGAGRG